jgi:hypothetical protein
MNLVQNIILAICLTLNLGIEENKFSVKPSVYLMPEKIFTNQANIDMVKKSRVIRANPPSIGIFKGNDTKIRGKLFQVRMPLPDLAAVFFKDPGKIRQTELVIRNWKLETATPGRISAVKFSGDQLAFRSGR